MESRLAAKRARRAMEDALEQQAIEQLEEEDNAAEEEEHQQPQPQEPPTDIIDLPITVRTEFVTWRTDFHGPRFGTDRDMIVCKIELFRVVNVPEMGGVVDLPIHGGWSIGAANGRTVYEDNASATDKSSLRYCDEAYQVKDTVIRMCGQGPDIWKLPKHHIYHITGLPPRTPGGVVYRIVITHCNVVRRTQGLGACLFFNSTMDGVN